MNTFDPSAFKFQAFPEEQFLAFYWALSWYKAISYKHFGVLWSP